MFLKFVRHNQVSGNICRGSLYTVHFQPNEMGGYNEYPRFISDACEIASGQKVESQETRDKCFPLALIYEAGVRRTNVHMRLSFGRGDRRSLLHLIDREAREQFLEELLSALRHHEDVRIEVAIAFGK